MQNRIIIFACALLLGAGMLWAGDAVEERAKPTAQSTNPSLIKDNGKLYLFVNIGPRLHQKISLAIAPGENVK